MKVLSLVISIVFAASNITFATPKDYSALRQPSTAVSRSVEVISERIAEADNEIYHNEISAARKLFREGESLWLRAKNSPDKDNVRELANEAIGKFEKAKEILDILSIKDIDAKRLLELIQGDKPEKRIAGHISRAQKTIKEAEKKTDLYKEDGNVDRSAKRPTSQYLHADPKGLIHATVGFFIFTPDGDIVFQRRAPDKVFFPNMLTLAACGHPDRTEKGEIKDIFTATKDEARGETGIPRIYGRRIRKIGQPDKIKGPYKYDQRVDFIAYEFVATSKEEADALRGISDEINEREKKTSAFVSDRINERVKKTSASVFDRLICNYNDEIWTLTLYTFGWDKKDAIEEEAKEVIQRTGIPIGDVNYNREVKSLYAYVATEEEMEILKTKKTEHKEAEVAKFEIDTRSIEDIAKDFQNNPEKYPDTFIPTFTNPVIIKQLADFQKEIRKSRDLIKETLGYIITEIETTAKTPVDKDTSQKTNPVYTLPEELTVKNKKLRIVPLTPELMIKKADEFFILQNSVAADVVWTEERDVIGVAKGRKDGPIQFDPELNCSFAALDENDVPVAVAMYSSADKRKGYAYLETFAVLPEYQGTAVASWILLHSFQEAKRQGFTHTSWITREELDETEKAHLYQRRSVRATPYYEIKVNAGRDEKKGKDGRIPPKEETGADNVPWEVRPGKWHIAYYKGLSDLYSLYADFRTKSALCTISNRLIIAVDTAA